MNQLLRLNDKVVVLCVEHPMKPAEMEALGVRWKEVVGDDVRLAVFPETQVVTSEKGEHLMFEFAGGVTPSIAAEFQRRWEEAVRG